MFFKFTHFARIPYSISEFLPGLMRNMIYTLSSESQSQRQGVEMRCRPWHHGGRKGVMRRNGAWIFPGRWYHFTLKWLQNSQECSVWNFVQYQETPWYIQKMRNLTVPCVILVSSHSIKRLDTSFISKVSTDTFHTSPSITNYFGLRNITPLCRIIFYYHPAAPCGKLLYRELFGPAPISVCCLLFFGLVWFGFLQNSNIILYLAMFSEWKKKSKVEKFLFLRITLAI